MGEIKYTAYLEGSLRLDAEGRWYHNGAPFRNSRVAELFSRSVSWDSSVRKWFVQIGEQRAAFSCDDTALFVAEVCDQMQPPAFRLTDGALVPISEARITAGDSNQLYLGLPDGQLARFGRGALQRLLHFAVDDTVVEIGGVRCVIPAYPGERRT